METSNGMFTLKITFQAQFKDKIQYFNQYKWTLEICGENDEPIENQSSTHQSKVATEPLPTWLMQDLEFSIQEIHGQMQMIAL